MILQIGDRAPDFALWDQSGNEVKLSDLLGKRVVLYFYPKDNTPGCTRQACAFAGAFGEYQRRGIEVIGVNRDSAATHAKFAEKYSLPFRLLSDPTGETLEAYGVWQEKKMCGKVGMGIVRTTFLIAPDGKIEGILPKVKPDQNASEILEIWK